MIRPIIRIDMRLTDNFVYSAIAELLPTGEGQLTYNTIANKCQCHPETVKDVVKRLSNAGRLVMNGGKGRRPVIYKVIK